MQPPADIIAAARAAQAKWKIPASVSIAQWADESGWGTKSPGNNPFGIKHMPGFPDQMIHTHEVVNGKRIPEDLPFAKFASIAQAFDVHAELLATHAVYAPAMAALPLVSRFVMLMGPRYATGIGYAATLMKIITGSKLTQYDGVQS